MGKRTARTQTYTGVRAAPDTASLDRLAGLTRTIGRGLNGGLGSIVGYDKGDPAMSFTGPVHSTPSAATAIGGVHAGPGNVYLAPAGFSESVSTDPDLDPFNALLLARMQS